jgi:hypothetical protein
MESGVVIFMVVSVGNGTFVCSISPLFPTFIGAERAFFSRNDHVPNHDKKLDS